MNNSISGNSGKAVGIWLLTGVGMIMIQVLLGGITRLTESGLSITEWKPITGMLPPLSTQAWINEFELYKHTDQFRYIHSDFTLSDFKFIFFWEWFHRFWARLMGIVFAVGFIYFLWKRRFKKEMILPLIILFVLGGVQGAIGWIMVKSGLVPEKYFVGHVELATHFVAALCLLVYTLWFALKLLVPSAQLLYHSALKRFLVLTIVLLFIQLTYGGFMAGLHAATSAPTWPTLNGDWFPATLFAMRGGENYVSNPIMVQFIHRGMAYIITLLIVIWYIKSSAVNATALFKRARPIPLVLVGCQVILGILTVLLSAYNNVFIWLGVAHQFVAMLLLMSLICLAYLVRKA
ncbi:MAG: COX15/CtaA family protein [Bacteroidetes bacterium]|nr:COX15/CtaA family protein [Bacteroidota bacterium]